MHEIYINKAGSLNLEGNRWSSFEKFECNFKLLTLLIVVIPVAVWYWRL